MLTCIYILSLGILLLSTYVFQYWFKRKQKKEFDKEFDKEFNYFKDKYPLTMSLYSRFEDNCFYFSTYNGQDHIRIENGFILFDFYHDININKDKELYQYIMETFFKDELRNEKLNELGI